MSTMTPGRWMRLGAEIYELNSNQEIERFIEWDDYNVTIYPVDYEEDENRSYEPPFTKTGKLKLNEEGITKSYNISITWLENFPFKAPVVSIQNFKHKYVNEENGTITNFNDEWSPALMTHHWLLMLLVKIQEKDDVIPSGVSVVIGVGNEMI